MARKDTRIRMSPPSCTVQPRLKTDSIFGEIVEESKHIILAGIFRGDVHRRSTPSHIKRCDANSAHIVRHMKVVQLYHSTV